MSISVVGEWLVGLETATVILLSDVMDRPQLSSLVTALNELSWSDVKQMAIHLDKLNFAQLTNIEERPIEERVMYTMKAWLDRDREASWDKVVSALRTIGKDVLARKIDEKQSITVSSPETTEQETSDSDCPTVTQQDSEISGWRRERGQQISYIAIMAAIVGAALAAAESGDSAIPLVLTGTGTFAALVAFYVKIFIVEGVPTGLRKLAVFAAVAAVVVAVLVREIRTANATAPTAATAPRVAVAIVSVIRPYRSIIQLAVGVILPLGAAVFAVFTTEAAKPVLVAVAVTGAVTIWTGAGVMVTASVVSVTAGVIAVAAAGAATARRPSQAAVARAAAAAVPVVVVVTAAFRAPVLKSAAGLAAVVAVAAVAVAVGLFPAVELAAAAVTVGTVIVAEAAAIVTAVLAVVLGLPPPAAAAAVIVIAAVALELASKLHYYLY